MSADERTTQSKCGDEKRMFQEEIKVMLGAKVSQSTRTVSEETHRHTCRIQHRIKEITHRGVLRVDHMTSWFERPIAVSSNKQWQVIVIVPIAITDSTPVYDHGMIQQVAVPFLRRLEALEDVGELGNVVPIDFSKRRQLLRARLVM